MPKGHHVLTEPAADAFSSLPTIRLDDESVIKQNVRCTFSGDTLPDQIIPVSYLTTRIKREGISSVDIVIPNGPKYDQAIDDYANDNGTFIVTYLDTLADGSQQQYSSAPYLIETVSSSRGGRNWSITLNGTNTFTLGSVVNKVTLSGVSLLRANASGSYTLRSRLDRRLSPNDRAVYEGIEYPVENITHIVNANNIYMEVTAVA